MSVMSVNRAQKPLALHSLAASGRNISALEELSQHQKRLVRQAQIIGDLTGLRKQNKSQGFVQHVVNLPCIYPIHLEKDAF